MTSGRARPVIAFDLDDFMFRLFVEKFKEDCCPNLIRTYGFDSICQSAFTLTCLDPYRITPPIEPSSERPLNMISALKGEDIPTDIIDVLMKLGFRATTQLSFLSSAYGDQPIHDFNLTEQKKLFKFSTHLQRNIPMEPLHSFKRYFAWKRTDGKETGMKYAGLNYLDLATKHEEESKEPDPKLIFSIDNLRDSIANTRDVLSKFAHATFSPQERFIRPVFKPVVVKPKIRNGKPMIIRQRSYYTTQTKRRNNRNLNRKPNYNSYYYYYEYCIRCGENPPTKGHKNCRNCYLGYLTSITCKNSGCRVTNINEKERWYHERNNCSFLQACCPWEKCGYWTNLEDMQVHLFLSTEKTHPSLTRFLKKSPTSKRKGNRLASVEDKFIVEIKNNENVPLSFFFDEQTFLAVFDGWGCSQQKTCKMMTGVFWIWILATPSMAGQYYYQLKIPYQSPHGECMEFCREAAVNSIQTPRVTVLQRKNKERLLKINVDRHILQRNREIFGKLKFDLLIYKH